MPHVFFNKEISLPTQWRSLILFGKNSATYKFAFAKSLLSLGKKHGTISLEDLAIPFSKNIVEHLRHTDKQGSSGSSRFLNYCRSYINGGISDDELYHWTVKLGFVNVLDAFQNINQTVIPNKFFEKEFNAGKTDIILTEHFSLLSEHVQSLSFHNEVEARWKLVETAWNLNIKANLLEVEYNDLNGQLYIQETKHRRIELSSIRDALNGYQKGKCFYSFNDIAIIQKHPNLGHVDHFMPHCLKPQFVKHNVNLDGVWNLVLATQGENSSKLNRLPDLRYLERLHKRNEFFIESKHPLAETIIRQTGKTVDDRVRFLQNNYNLAKDCLISVWKCENELPSCF